MSNSIQPSGKELLDASKRFGPIACATYIPVLLAVSAFVASIFAAERAASTGNSSGVLTTFGLLLFALIVCPIAWLIMKTFALRSQSSKILESGGWRSQFLTIKQLDSGWSTLLYSFASPEDAETAFRLLHTFAKENPPSHLMRLDLAWLWGHDDDKDEYTVAIHYPVSAEKNPGSMNINHFLERWRASPEYAQLAEFTVAAGQRLRFFQDLGGIGKSVRIV
jgi:hypothetical protein